MLSHQSVLLHAMCSEPNHNGSDERWGTTCSYGWDLGVTTSKRSSCPFVPVPQKVSVAAIASISSKVLRGLLHWEKRKGTKLKWKDVFRSVRKSFTNWLLWWWRYSNVEVRLWLTVISIWFIQSPSIFWSACLFWIVSKDDFPDGSVTQTIWHIRIESIFSCNS